MAIPGLDYSIVELAERLDPGNATADNFDLCAFQQNGGKLLSYHGFADGLIPTGSSIYFREHVFRTMTDTDLDSFYKFYLVPGMQHCLGGDVPWAFNGGDQAAELGTGILSVPGFEDPKHGILLVLMQWVEHGIAPDQIIATKFVNDTVDLGVARTRPLCPYPSTSFYKGSGDVNDASNFGCR